MISTPIDNPNMAKKCPALFHWGPNTTTIKSLPVKANTALTGMHTKARIDSSVKYV